MNDRERISAADFGVKLGLRYRDLLESDFLMFADLTFEGDNPLVVSVYGLNNKFLLADVVMSKDNLYGLAERLVEVGVASAADAARAFLVRDCRFRVLKCVSRAEAEAVAHLAVWANAANRRFFG